MNGRYVVVERERLNQLVVFSGDGVDRVDQAFEGLLATFAAIRSPVRRATKRHVLIGSAQDDI